MRPALLLRAGGCATRALKILLRDANGATHSFFGDRYTFVTFSASGDHAVLPSAGRSYPAISSVTGGGGRNVSQSYQDCIRIVSGLYQKHFLFLSETYHDSIRNVLESDRNSTVFLSESSRS